MKPVQLEHNHATIVKKDHGSYWVRLEHKCTTTKHHVWHWILYNLQKSKPMQRSQNKKKMFLISENICFLFMKKSFFIIYSPFPNPFVSFTTHCQCHTVTHIHTHTDFHTHMFTHSHAMYTPQTRSYFQIHLLDFQTGELQKKHLNVTIQSIKLWTLGILLKVKLTAQFFSHMSQK